MFNKQSRRHRVLAALCVLTAMTSSAISAGASDLKSSHPMVTVKGKIYANVHGTLIPAPYPMEIVEINGKFYAKDGGYLFPASFHVTELPGGRIGNKWWAVDKSSWVPPKVDIKIPPPLDKRTPGRWDATTKGGGTSIGGGTDPGSPSTSPIAVRDAGTKHYITISADVLFEFDKWDLTEKAQAVLSELGPILAKYGSCTTIITGHTDSVGGDDYNQQLSEKRAQSVKEWLTGHGFAAGPITTSGAGERSPVAPNTYNDGTDFPAGRAKNRRVEIVVDTAE